MHLPLRALTAQMPNARLTEFGNYNVKTRVVSRSSSSTYIIPDSPEEHTEAHSSRPSVLSPKATRDLHHVPRHVDTRYPVLYTGSGTHTGGRVGPPTRFPRGGGTWRSHD
jgi:hypothetical protein